MVADTPLCQRQQKTRFRPPPAPFTIFIVPKLPITIFGLPRCLHTSHASPIVREMPQVFINIVVVFFCRPSKTSSKLNRIGYSGTKRDRVWQNLSQNHLIYSETRYKLRKMGWIYVCWWTNPLNTWHFVIIMSIWRSFSWQMRSSSIYVEREVNDHLFVIQRKVYRFLTDCHFVGRGGILKSNSNNKITKQAQKEYTFKGPKVINFFT